MTVATDVVRHPEPADYAYAHAFLQSEQRARQAVGESRWRA